MEHDYNVHVNFSVFADSPEQAKDRVQYYVDSLRLGGVFIVDVQSNKKWLEDLEDEPYDH